MTASTATTVIVFLPLVVGGRTELTIWLEEVGLTIIYRPGLLAAIVADPDPAGLRPPAPRRRRAPQPGDRLARGALRPGAGLDHGPPRSHLRPAGAGPGDRNPPAHHRVGQVGDLLGHGQPPPLPELRVRRLPLQVPGRGGGQPGRGGALRPPRRAPPGLGVQLLHRERGRDHPHPHPYRPRRRRDQPAARPGPGAPAPHPRRPDPVSGGGGRGGQQHLLRGPSCSGRRGVGSSTWRTRSRVAWRVWRGWWTSPVPDPGAGPRSTW